MAVSQSVWGGVGSGLWVVVDYFGVESIRLGCEKLLFGEVIWGKMKVFVYVSS